MKKKFPLIVASFLITINSYAYRVIGMGPEVYKLNYCQADTTIPTIKNYEYYNQKSAGQKTGAWLLVSGGAICLLVASGMALTDVQTDLSTLFETGENRKKDNREKTENILIYVGCAAVLGSIPLFIAGRRNKLKARLSIQDEKLSTWLPAGSGKYAHGITLTIPIGK